MHHIDYKTKYKNLKQKLKFLIYEQECFLEELRKSQKKLLRVSRDKSFLLDRLLLHMKVDETSGDSDATASSDSEPETNTTKRKKTGMMLGGHLSGLQSGARKRLKPTAKRPKAVKPSVKQQRAKNTPTPMMSRSELERHLEEKSEFNGLDLQPHKQPPDLFSDNSNHLSDDADEDLVIDVP